MQQLCPGLLCCDWCLLLACSVQHIPVPVAPAADGAAQSAPKPNQPVAGGGWAPAVLCLCCEATSALVDCLLVLRNCFAIQQLEEASFAHAAGAMEEGPLNPIAGSKPITTSLQTGPGVEFGAVKLQTVDEAVTLRQKMAAR